VIASIQTSFPTSDHWFAEKALGKQRARRESYRWDTMQKRGVTMAGGTDAAATRLMTVVNGKVTFEGETAFPPGDATCKSGLAPA
jgi:predicted amidohydrolase YtcJ